MATEVRTARPVVLIGAGGTGKQTLLYLRRMFFERYGVKSLPHVAQVVIDTDGAASRLDGEQYDEFDREVAFEKDELLVTPIGAALYNVRKNRSQYPHIDAWLDKDLDAHGIPTDGAGQIRSFGRLAFFEHFHDINRVLEQAYDKVKRNDTFQQSLERFNIDVEKTGVDTWLVFSVAGGTGAGMFLDLAFLAKRIARTHGGGDAKSIILLPTAFVSNPPLSYSNHSDHRPFANAYAALMELETYNFQRPQGGDPRKLTEFPAQWTQALYAQKVHEVGPVFLNSWLVDSESRAGGGKLHGERMALCQMMSEWLFLQYGATNPALLQQIRSNQSNQEKDLVDLAEIGIKHQSGAGAGAGPDDDEDNRGKHQATQTFSRRYSSFGLSKIYVPTTNIAGQAYAKLVGDIAGLWLEPDKGGDPRFALDRIASDIHIPPNPQVAGYTRELAIRMSRDNRGEPLARRFDRLINDKLQKVKGAGFEHGAESEARDWFNREVMLKLLDAASAAARRGEISKVIQPENVKAVRAHVVAVLDRFVAQTLATPGERLGHAEAALRLLVRDYTQLISEANAQAQNNEAAGKRLQDELEQLLVWAADHKGFDRATIFEAAFGKMHERATAELRRQALLAAAEVAREIAEHVGTGRTVKGEDGKDKTVDTGLLHDLAVLRATLGALKRRSAERIQALRRRPVSSLNSRAPAADANKDQGPEAELKQLYQDEEGQPIEREQLESYETKLYELLSHTGFVSPWHLKGPEDASRVEATFNEMLAFATAQLSHLPTKMEDAILRFDQKFNRVEAKGQYQAELERVAARGTPWLPLYTHNLGGSDDYKNITTSYYLARSPQADAGALKRLLDQVKDREVVSGPLDTVYFEAELAGVPLCAIRHIDLYRNAYIGYLHATGASTRVVHTELDLEKYVDLLPYTSEEMELRSRAVRAFIRGVVLGVIVPDPEARPGRIEWQFLETTRMSVNPVRRPLGRYRTAIQQLAQVDSVLWKSLLREVDKAVNQVSVDNQGKVYSAISQMAEKAPIGGREWESAAEGVRADMVQQHGEAVVQAARAAATDMKNWAEPIASGGEHPFWRLKAPAPQARPG